MSEIQMIAPNRRVGAFRRGIARMFDMLMALFAANYIIAFTFPLMFKDKADRIADLSKFIDAAIKAEEAYIDTPEYAEYLKLVNFQYVFVFITAIVLLFLFALLVNKFAKGQTVGKMLGGIKVVNQDGAQASTLKILAREGISWAMIFVFLLVSSALAANGVQGFSIFLSLASAAFMGSIILSTVIRKKPGEAVKQTWYDQLLQLEVIVK